MKLTVDRLSFSYSGKPVLKDVSLALEQGDVLCVLGPNGVGKSTLFRCVLGLLKGYSGSVMLGDREVRELSHRESARRIAYIPQTSSPVFRYNVFNTVLMGTASQLSTLASPGQKQEKAALAALRSLGIEHLAHRSVGDLSGGEQQLTSIARALAQDSPFIVMDEPTASLDYGNTLRVMNIIKSLAQRGYGIILSTHDPDQALRYGSKALVLDGGRVKSFGAPSEAITPAILSEIYGVPIDIAALPGEAGPYWVCVPAEKYDFSNTRRKESQNHG